MKTLFKIKHGKPAHSYDVEVLGGYIQVECANRAVALRLVSKLGYEVRSINMIG